MNKPSDKNYIMPAEWSNHDCCWMQWPTDVTGDYSEIESWAHFDLEKARVAWANVANTISKFEDLKMIVHPDNISSAKNLLNSSIQVLPLELNDAWARDSGAIFVLNRDGKLGGVDSDFNCWGYKINYELDDKVAKFMINDTKAEYFKNNMVLEGGSIHVDGEGTLLTTEQCLLNKNRNPSLSKLDIEKNLKDYFGISKVIWLKHGTDEGTDGHIDNVACFTEPGVISAMVCSDKNDTYYEILNENLETLKTSTDSRGNRLKIIEIEMSYQRLVPGSDEPCSYINYYIANNGIIMPIYNDLKADEAAVNQIKSAFPNRKVVCIDGHDIHLGGGNVHCITQQQPKGHV